MRLHSFSVPSSAWSEQPFVGSRGEPSMRVHSFSVLSSAWSEQPFADSQGEPSMPGGAGAFVSPFQARLGRSNRSPVRAANLPCPAGRLHSFSVLSSVRLEQPCAGSRGEPSMPGGAGAFVSPFQARLGRSNRSPVRAANLPCQKNRCFPFPLSLFHSPLSPFPFPLSTLHSPLSSLPFPLSSLPSPLSSLRFPLSSLPLRRFFLCVSIQ